MYNYIPVKTIFTATLWLHYMEHVMLFPMINILYFYINPYPANVENRVSS
jgi:hypothetical protein